MYNNSILDISETTMNSYPYLNFQEIDFLYDSFVKDKPRLIKKKRSYEYSFNPKVTQSYETDVLATISYIEKLNTVTDFLKHKKEIEYHRPTIYSDTDNVKCNFVEEICQATKLYFPSSTLSEIFGINHLNVWIAEPDSKDLSIDEYDFTGTFLYLIELLTDRGDYRSTISGCSALQVISNISQGKNFFALNRAEPLGRQSTKHPIEKLQDLGAYVIDDRKIRTLYKKRYMTNEQRFDYEGKVYRCNDLLGYPLMIDY